MGTVEYFPCMEFNKKNYFRKLEYFCAYFLAQSVYVWCPSQIVVNSYSQHSVVLYLFNDVVFRCQRGGGGGGGGGIRYYILPFLSSGY